VRIPEPTELHPSGLILRVPRPSDAIQALELLRDPEVALWNEAPDVLDVPSAEAWCARGADWSSGQHATFSVVTETGGLVGNVSLFALDNDHWVPSRSLGASAASRYQSR
jgi:RimJ/RimL family protein N-acetyltransferase